VVTEILAGNALEQWRRGDHAVNGCYEVDSVIDEHGQSDFSASLPTNSNAINVNKCAFLRACSIRDVVCNLCTETWGLSKYIAANSYMYAMRRLLVMSRVTAL